MYVPWKGFPTGYPALVLSDLGFEWFDERPLNGIQLKLNLEYTIEQSREAFTSTVASSERMSRGWPVFRNGWGTFEGMGSRRSLRGFSETSPRGIAPAIALLASLAGAASLRQVTGFGNNPSNIKMYLYVPDKVSAHPPVLVGMHWCHGTGPAFHSGTGYAQLADRYGFIVIYPNANSGDSCWDVHSTAALTHNGGSDPSGIVSMVEYVVKTYHADSTRVFATGHSSGGMMTNVMLGSYPDVFSAGAAFAGVPFSCFAGAGSWNGDCAAGKIGKSGAAWGDAVRAAYPGYAGPRPRIQLWHGTQDAILDFKNFGEEIKEWTNVLGAGATPISTENNTPQSGWIRTRYANPEGAVLVEAIQETGQPHNLQILADKAVAFFGLDGSSSGLNNSDPRGLQRPNAGRMRVFQDPASPSMRIELDAQPGSATFEWRSMDGSMQVTVAEQSSPDGSFHVVWNGDPGHPGLKPGVHLLTARTAGQVVASRPVVRF